jgi:hypothetical protein
MDEHPNALATKLEAVTVLALDKLDEVLRRTEPVDEDEARLVRSHIAAATVAVNAQLRADAIRMRAARTDKALERLIELIATKEGTVPCVAAPDAIGSTGSAVGR